MVTTVDLARAVAVPKTMLDFLPKLVIIIHRIVPCDEHPEGDVVDRASFLTIFNLCEDLRVPEREVFTDVFKAATLQKTSIQSNNARTRLPAVSWCLAIGGQGKKEKFGSSRACRNPIHCNFPRNGWQIWSGLNNALRAFMILQAGF